MIIRPEKAIRNSGFGQSAYYDQASKGLRTKFIKLGSSRASGKRDSVAAVEDHAFAAGLTDEQKVELVKWLDKAVIEVLNDEEILAHGLDFIRKRARENAEKNGKLAA